MADKISHKKGTTFNHVGPLSIFDIDDNEIADLTGWSGRAQAKSKKTGDVFDFSFSFLSESPAIVQLRVEEDYSDTWPVGHYDMDIRLISPEGDSTATDTILFVQEEGVTK